LFKFENNPFKNNKVTANNSKKKMKISNNLTFKVKVIYEYRSRSVRFFLKGYPWRLLCSSLKTIHSKITKLQPIIAKKKTISII
jgi:hypothetical protein